MNNEFINKAYEEIVEEMLIDFAYELGVEKISNASDIAIKSKVLAAQIEGLYYNQEYILNQAFPQTATEKYLEMHAEVFRTYKKKATKAKGFVRMGRKTCSNEDRPIPKDTLFSTEPTPEGNIITGITLDEAMLKAGTLYIDIPSEVQEAGEYGNVGAGRFTVLNEPPAGIEYVTNIGQFSCGTDEENEEIFRERILNIIKNPSSGGNKSDYENWALEIEGVIFSKCLPLNRGAGTVDVLIGTSSGMPSEELITEVYNHIKNKRPVGADVKVLKPEILKVDVSIKVAPSPGYTVNGLKIHIISVIEEYIKSIKIDGTFKISQLIAKIYSIKGIDDLQIITPESNVTLSGIQVAQAGVINVL